MIFMNCKSSLLKTIGFEIIKFNIMSLKLKIKNIIIMISTFIFSQIIKKKLNNLIFLIY